MSFLRLILVAAVAVSCQNAQKTSKAYTDFSSEPGWTSIFQTYTSDTATTINIMRPRLLKGTYYVEEDKGPVSKDYKNKTPLKVVKTTKGQKVHWQWDRIFIDKLDPGKTYRLLIVNGRRKKLVDWRRFKTLDIKKTRVKFVVGSCMSDSHAYVHLRDKMWERMAQVKPDFVMLLGDQVYVDDFDFVSRKNVTEFDLWQRYIDSMRKLLLFQQRDLIPVMAVWDDHDYGLNNSDGSFKQKQKAKVIFDAFFGGVAIPGVVNQSKVGVSFAFNGFGQKFMMMDNRYERSSNKKSPHGQWGKTQHTWFIDQVKKSQGPVWLANGGQFFAHATVKTSKDGKSKQVNESFIDDQPEHWQRLMSDLKIQKQPVVFLSGDIHYSEISKVEKELLGYPTYEITSSPLHSYIYRQKSGPVTWLNNPRRLVSVREHNFILIDSQRSKTGLQMNVQSLGVKQEAPFFEENLSVMN